MARPTPPPRELTYVPLAQIGEDTTFRLRHPGDVSSLARSIAQAGQLFPIEVRKQGERFQAITGFRRLAALRILCRNRVLVRIHPEISDEAAALVAAADALDNAPLERGDLLELRERYRAMGWSTPALEELITRALEKAEERLEDLAADLQGLPRPDRTVPDEDAIEDEEGPPAPAAAEAPAPASVPAPAAAVPAPAPVAAAEAPAPLSAAAAAESAPSSAASAPQGPVVPPEEPPGPAPLGRPRAPVQEAPREMTVAELAEDAARRLSVLTQDLAILADRWDSVPSHLRRIVAEQIDYYRQLGDWLAASAGDSK